jgi:branched-chain amino acid aminotransferase
MSLLWMNGTLVDKAEARVSPVDHGLLYGDGVWEPLRLFEGRLFRAEEHIAALFQAAAGMGIAIPLSTAELIAAMHTTIQANSRSDGYIRVIITRGPGTLGPDPRKIDPQVIIIAEEYQPFPQELYGHGLHAATHWSDYLPNPARLLGQPHIVLAKQHALRNGCLEAVIVNQSGAVAGSTEGTVFAVRDGAIEYSPGQPPDATVDALVEAIREQRMLIAEGAVGMSELHEAAEVFQIGTACGVIGIIQIDGRTIGTGSEGPLTRQIRELYAKLARSG